MTTAGSPLSRLKAQADEIAAKIKIFKRDQSKGDIFKFAVAMDDKIVIIEAPWALIEEISEPALAAYILGQMQEEVGNDDNSG